MATSTERKARRQAYARKQMITKRYTSALRNSFQEKLVVHDAVRVTGATVAIGGHFYPGEIDTATAKVVNVGRPAAARYEAVGGSAPARAQEQIATGGGGSGSGAPNASAIQTLVQQYLLEHTSLHYIAAHNHTDPPDRTFYGTDWGIFGGSDVDESDKIIQMLEDVGPNATIFIAAQNPADPVIKVSKPISIYNNNVHFKSEQGTLWRYGAKGGVRIMGEIAQYSPFESGFAMKLRANSYENASGELVLPFVTGQVEDADLAVGMKLVIRGRNDASGKAIEKQVTYIKSIDGDDVTCVDEAAYTFQPTYDDSDWPPDATTGTTIYPVIFQLFTANRSRGDMTATVSSIDGFAVGDLVEIGTNETEWDVNNGAISGTPPYPNGRHYLNPARKEQATIVSITGSGPYTVKFNRSLSHNYATARYAGITKLLPVRNSRISGLRCEYYEDQVNRSVHPLSIVFGYNCHVFDCHVDGRGGQRGQGCRIAYSYNCSVYNSTFVDPKFVGSGDGYGPSLYYSTRCRVIGNYISGCRHSVLLQLAVDCAIYDNQSDDDYISAYDAHGVNSHDCIFANNMTRRSSNNSPDSSDCGAFRIGNTSHCVGDHYITVIGNTIEGYVHTNSSAMDVLAASSNVTFIGNVVNGAQIGFRFKRNPNWITPVQTATNIQVIGNRFSNCTKAIEVICDPDFDNVNASGKIEGLLIKDNISDGNSRHWDIEGRLGLTNLRVVGNEIWNSIPTSGMYAVDIDECLGTVEVAYNICCGANRGIRIQDTENAVVAFNILSGTVDSIALTTAGTTTGLVASLNIPFTGGGGGDPLAEFTAKGQLFVGTGSGTGTRLSVGTNNHVLAADSAQSSGLKYAAVDTLIADGTITNAKRANMAQATISGRAAAAGTGAPTDLSADQAVAVLKTSPNGWKFSNLNDVNMTLNFASDGWFVYYNHDTPGFELFDITTLISSTAWPQKITDPGTNADPASGTAGAYVYYDNDLRYDGAAGDGVFVIDSKSSAGNARDIRMIGRNIAFAHPTLGNMARFVAAGDFEMASSSYAIKSAIFQDRGTSGVKLWASDGVGLEIETGGEATFHDHIVVNGTTATTGASWFKTRISVGSDIHLSSTLSYIPTGSYQIAAMQRTSNGSAGVWAVNMQNSTDINVVAGVWANGNTGFVGERRGVNDFIIYARSANRMTFGSSNATIHSDLVVQGSITYSGGAFGAIDTIAVTPSSTSQDGLVVNMPASTTGDAIEIQYNGVTSYIFTISATASQNYIADRNLGNNTPGPTFFVGRNTSDGAVGPAAGSYAFRMAAGTQRYIWVDASGNLRIHTSRPTGSTGSPTVADTAGTVVGTQTSHASYKRILGEPVSDAQALDYLIEAAGQVREFEYLSGAYGGERFSGLILDGPAKHRYGMDADAERPAGRSLNEINGFGDMLKAIRYLAGRVADLEARPN